MAKYTVYLSTTASLAVTVEVPDDLDPSDARGAAIEKAFEEAPTDVCAQCAGWRQPWSLDLAEWDVQRDDDGIEADPELQS